MKHIFFFKIVDKAVKGPAAYAEVPTAAVLHVEEPSTSIAPAMAAAHKLENKEACRAMDLP